MKLLTFHNGGTLIGLKERERERESAEGERVGGGMWRARRSNVITTISLPNVSGDKCIDVYQYEPHHHLG